MNNIYSVQLMAITSHIQSAVLLKGKNLWGLKVFETSTRLRIKSEIPCALFYGTYYQWMDILFSILYS